MRAVPRTRSESGQAAIETVAAVPLVLLAAAVAWQLALTGHTLWLCAHAARAAARAELLGESPERAGDRWLPWGPRSHLSVRRVGTGGVRVKLRVPLLVRAWRSPVEVAAVSSLAGG